MNRDRDRDDGHIIVVSAVPKKAINGAYSYLNNIASILQLVCHEGHRALCPLARVFSQNANQLMAFPFLLEIGGGALRFVRIPL